jgi:hypothetical protein
MLKPRNKVYVLFCSGIQIIQTVWWECVWLVGGNLELLSKQSYLLPLRFESVLPRIHVHLNGFDCYQKLRFMKKCAQFIYGLIDESLKEHSATAYFTISESFKVLRDRFISKWKMWYSKQFADLIFLGHHIINWKCTLESLLLISNLYV